MAGETLEMARESLRTHISGGFATSLTITPIEGEVFEINGIVSVHSQSFNEEGLPIIGENSHVLICEQDIVDLGYETRVGGKVRLKGWFIDFDHAIGSIKSIVSECEPDYTLGVVKLKLSNRKNA